MPSRPPTLYCDEDVSVVLAAMLRARGFPVTTTRDAGYLGRTDEQQLHVASDANQILVTHNRADFERLHRQWLEAGRRHAGIIIARRRQPGECVWQDIRLPDSKVLIHGVIAHTTSVVEHPETVAERLMSFASLVGRERVIAGADCGFAQGALFQRQHPTVMWAKFEALVQGARLASERLWG